MTTDTTTRGGRRAGAGPSTLGERAGTPDVPSVKIELRLTQTLADMALKIGKGNRSQGIRDALIAYDPTAYEIALLALRQIAAGSEEEPALSVVERAQEALAEIAYLNDQE
jgi:hypothetical protein